jgi:cytochrome P450
MQFGMGHRQCIGRNIALISIMKIVVTLMRNYSLELVNKDEGCELVSVGIGEKKGPLMVRVKRRG